MEPHFRRTLNAAKLVPVSSQDKDPAALVIGARLIAALREREMSQRKLARRLAGPRASSKRVDAVRRNVSRWCAGDAKPDAKNRVALARELQTPADHFQVGPAEAANVIAALEERVANLEAERDRAPERRRGGRGHRGGSR